MLILSWLNQVVVFEKETYQLEDGDDEEEEDTLQVKHHTSLMLLSLCKIPVNFGSSLTSLFLDRRFSDGCRSIGKTSN